jgi:hypothetical protein
MLIVFESIVGEGAAGVNNVAMAKAFPMSNVPQHAMTPTWCCWPSQNSGVPPLPIAVNWVPRRPL